MPVNETLVVFLFSVIFFDNSFVTSALIGNIHRTRNGGLSPNIVDSVNSGTLLALDHCQNVFQWDRWNCPKEQFIRHKKLPANKEAAFSKAIVAAGIVYSITKNCSRGEIKECACNPRLDSSTPQPLLFNDKVLSVAENTSYLSNDIVFNNSASKRTIEWSWGGCSDDPTFGARVVKELLENSEKSISASSSIGKHNYRVGREIIRQTMIKKCRCHGVSGSCSLQTCWMEMTPFREVARKLRKKYNKATRLTKEAAASSISWSNSIKWKLKENQLPVPKNALVFMEQSPDYCVPNLAMNINGTKGRYCSKQKSVTTTISDKKRCRNLCTECGYRVKKEIKSLNKRCNCTFQWCCEVKCDWCVENVEEFYCY